MDDSKIIDLYWERSEIAIEKTINKYEETFDYNIYGNVSNTWNICYQYDKSKAITDRLLDYTFHRVEYTIYTDGNDVKSGWAKTIVPPTKSGILYPIITLKEAQKKFRNGDFFCYGDETKVAKSAKIISVELIYLVDQYQIYLQPFYKFTITDETWDISHIMECDNPEDFTGESNVFVPAVIDKYLDFTQPYLYSN